jgi:hypothetical protein
MEAEAVRMTGVRWVDIAPAVLLMYVTRPRALLDRGRVRERYRLMGLPSSLFGTPKPRHIAIRGHERSRAGSWLRLR